MSGCGSEGCSCLSGLLSLMIVLSDSNASTANYWKEKLICFGGLVKSVFMC